MGNITDLGFLVEPRQVRLHDGGTVYTLPPDVPVPLMLLLEHSDGAEITTELVEHLYAEILDLFRVYQPDLERLPIGLTQMLTLVRRVYAADTEEDEQVPPPKPKRAGTRSTAAKRKPASRSSS